MGWSDLFGRRRSHREWNEELRRLKFGKADASEETPSPDAARQSAANDKKAQGAASEATGQNTPRHHEDAPLTQLWLEMAGDGHSKSLPALSDASLSASQEAVEDTQATGEANQTAELADDMAATGAVSARPQASQSNASSGHPSLRSPSSRSQTEAHDPLSAERDHSRLHSGTGDSRTATFAEGGSLSELAEMFEDEVVVALLYGGAVRLDQIARAIVLRRRQSAPTLWRCLLEVPDVDREAVLAEAARIGGIAPAPVDEERPSVEFIKAILLLLPPSVQHALFEWQLLPCGFAQGEKDEGRVLLLATCDPTRPELEAWVQQLPLAVELRYAPERILKKRLAELENFRPPVPSADQLPTSSVAADTSTAGSAEKQSDPAVKQSLEMPVSVEGESDAQPDTGTPNGPETSAVEVRSDNKSAETAKLTGTATTSGWSATENASDDQPEEGEVACGRDESGGSQSSVAADEATDQEAVVDWASERHAVDELPTKAGLEQETGCADGPPSEPAAAEAQAAAASATALPEVTIETIEPASEAAGGDSEQVEDTPSITDSEAEETPASVQIVLDDLPELKTAISRDRVVSRLLEKEVVALHQVYQAYQRQQDEGLKEPLWRVLAQSDHVPQDAIYEEAARLYAFPLARLEPGKPSPEFVRSVMDTFEEEVRERLIALRVVPFEVDLDAQTGAVKLVLVTHDPMRPEVHRLMHRLKLERFELQYAPQGVIMQALLEAYPRRNEYLERVQEEEAYDLGTSYEAETELIDEDALEAEINRSKLINLFEATLVEAVRQGASDIHIFPNNEKKVEIHFRIDGRLTRWHVEDKVHPEALIAVIKDQAINVDRFERDAAQDGFIQRWIDDHLIRFRVSVLPIANALEDLRSESIVIRVLDDRKVIKDLRLLGLNKKALERFERAIRQPYGMVIVTGPTGSGKSTTLYAALHQVVSPEVNVLTIEDPVEYIIPGVRQIKLNHKLGLEDALRAILRHDPDIVMVGEMRDRQTAELAIKLANTGHLTFST
ncbi:MAG: ATPase, T2SS/T4P/T4SS family, partial [Rhodothermus sp.]|nr:ATPase, T2SS/T4P/T4SS family [Rhodothermus sp.]